MAATSPRQSSKYSDSIHKTVTKQEKNTMQEPMGDVSTPYSSDSREGGYTIENRKVRTKRMQIMIYPDLWEHLDFLVKSGQIKSKNDFIHCAIEEYLKNNNL